MDASAFIRPFATESLSLATEHYMAGRYSACLDACAELSAEGSPDREAALILTARTSIRQQRHRDVIRLLTAELPEFSPLGKLQAEMLLAAAHASVNDFDAANLYVESMREGATGDVPDALRSEMLNAEALVAWIAGDLDAAEAALARDASDSSPHARARNEITSGWIAAKRARYDEQARKFMRGIETLQTSAPL